MKNKIIALMIICMMIVSSNQCVYGQTMAVDKVSFQDNKIIYFDMDLHSLTIPNGKAQLISLPTECKTVSIGNPDVCDIVMMGGSDFLLVGKKPGLTNIYVWLVNDIKLESSIKVYDDTDALEELLKKILPYETDITVSIAHNTIILSGYVNKPTSIENALKIAEAYMAGRDTTQSIDVKVVNMLKVKNEKQILLEVRLAEVARSESEDTGFDWRYTGDIFEIPSDVSFLDGGTPAYHGGTDALLQAPATNAGQGTSLGSFINNKGNKEFAYGLDFLVGKGLAKIIAKPNLLVRNGEEASFLAGGEFPVPVQEEDSVRIEWKEFGVKLTFTPNLDERDNIELILAPEVSALDFTNAVTANGIEIPSLKTRKTETKVVLRHGETFYISGLISQSESQTFSHMPGISSIPILGNLFKKKDNNSSDTELVVFVTPRIISPIKKDIEKTFDDPEKMRLITNSLPAPFEQPHADAIKDFIEQDEKPEKSLEQLRQEEIDKEIERLRKERTIEEGEETKRKKENKITKNNDQRKKANKMSTKTINKDGSISITMENPFEDTGTKIAPDIKKEKLPWYKKLFKREDKNDEKVKDLQSKNYIDEARKIEQSIIREQDSEYSQSTKSRNEVAHSIASSDQIDTHNTIQQQSYLDETCEELEELSKLQG